MSTLNSRFIVFLLLSVLVLPLAAAAPSLAQDLTGTVVETMNASGYTYLNLKTADSQQWVAIPETTVAQGETISVMAGMEMKGFHSSTFDRTFTSIIFSPGISETAHSSPAPKQKEQQTSPPDSFDAAVAAEKQTAVSPAQPEIGSSGSKGAIAPFVEASVEKAAGENGYTVAELFEKAKELDGRTVRIRAQIVKYNPNIMGRNWLHLQDGTGDPMLNTHDLVATVKEDVTSPKIVTVEGTVAADKDFGAGYKYAVILENGVILE